MTTARDLAQQHVKEFQLRLRHVDELMSSARRAATESGQPAAGDELLARIEANRAQLAAEIEDLGRWHPPHESAAHERHKGVDTALRTLGTELEKALAAIVARQPR